MYSTSFLDAFHITFHGLYDMELAGKLHIVIHMKFITIIHTTYRDDEDTETLARKKHQKITCPFAARCRKVNTIILLLVTSFVVGTLVHNTM